VGLKRGFLLYDSAVNYGVLRQRHFSDGFVVIATISRPAAVANDSDEAADTCSRKIKYSTFGREVVLE
jgi:hypothetical protein